MSERNKKSVQKVSKQVKVVYPKTDVRYWEGKVSKPTFTRRGQRGTGTYYRVLIQHDGKRVNFPLKTANKAVAARKAREIYMSLLENGWEETLEEYKPKRAKSGGGVSRQGGVKRSGESGGGEGGVLDRPTVGEFIEAARGVSEVSERTFHDYAGSLRKIVADIFGINSDNSKYDYRKGGRKRWLARVNAVKLDRLTPARIQKWKLDYVKSRDGGENPKVRRSVTNSANSYIRQARSLFAPKILKFVGRQMTLPDPLPFEGVELFRRNSTQYVSRVDIVKLIRAAKDELGASQAPGETEAQARERHQQYKIFLLATFAGLRRNEIDKLLWEQMDLDGGRVVIEATEFFQPKSEDSRGAVELDPEVVGEFRRFAEERRSDFVVETDKPWKKRRGTHLYRAQRYFKALIQWLAGHGVEDRKPLHLLRKEAGSLVCQHSGLYAASRFLRHADIQTTAAFYIDKRDAITVGLGEHLRAGEDAPEEPRSGGNVTSFQAGKKDPTLRRGA